MHSPYDVLLKPVVSEKSMALMEENKYTFYVHPRANKLEIKDAVEKIFKVHVEDVHTLKVHGKVRRQGKFVGRTSDRKKAIVKIKPGEKIEIFEGL